MRQKYRSVSVTFFALLLINGGKCSGFDVGWMADTASDLQKKFCSNNPAVSCGIKHNMWLP